jgi:hypothetical protein
MTANFTVPARFGSGVPFVAVDVHETTNAHASSAAASFGIDVVPGCKLHTCGSTPFIQGHERIKGSFSASAVN